MSTRIIYNGVEIRNCLTRVFDQEAVYDASGTDLLYHKFTIHVQGYVHGIYQNTTPNVGVKTLVPMMNPEADLTADSASAVINQQNARQRLLQPRKPFTMIVGDKVLLSAKAYGDTTTLFGISNKSVVYFDVNNGPKPQRVAIQAIAGTSLIPIEFSIEICAVECETENNSTGGALNNRWTVADEMDHNWYTTRTIHGRLRVRYAALNPNLFRAMVFPPLQPGFRRERISTTTSPDGLELEYTVVDKEIYAACPHPGVTWEGTVAWNSGQEASKLYGECHVVINGSKLDDRTEMLIMALDVCYQKLYLHDPRNLLTYAQLVEYLHENRIEVRAAVMAGSTGDKVVPILNLPSNTRGKQPPKEPNPDEIEFGRPYTQPGYNKEESRTPPYYGTATLTGLFVSYLQTPCGTEFGISQTRDQVGQAETGKPAKGTGQPPSPGETSTQITTKVGDLPPVADIKKNYSQEATAVGVYSSYSLEVSYHVAHNVLQLPIAQGATAANPNEPTSTFVRLAQPTARRTVTVVGKRLGAWPKMPKVGNIALSNNNYAVVLDEQVTPQTPVLINDGKTKEYEIRLEWTVGFARPLTGGERLQLGKIPWDTAAINDNAVDNGLFETALNF